MGRLILLAMGVALVSCQTPPAPGSGTGLSSGPHPTPGAELLRRAPTPAAPGEPKATAWPLASPLALDTWPVGWVLDPEGAHPGFPVRFWSDRRQTWNLALDPNTPLPKEAFLLERLYRASSGDEAARAAWHLWLVYKAASLVADARAWLDQSARGFPSPVIRLEQAWDQEFRLRDGTGARALLPGVSGWPQADDDRKARLLRQRLFLGTLDLAPAGIDRYISTLALDRDDLWMGTWNGAVGRWSLTTGALEAVLAPGETVAPIKLLTPTGWFVYAFQDQNLLRYSKVTGTWRTFAYPPGWTGLRVQGVVADGQESLWVAYLGLGLWHWNHGDWTQVDAGGGGPFLNALASDGTGGFWIGTKDRGLWSWKAGVWAPVPASPGAPTNISVIEASPQGQQWAVGTWGEGLWLLRDGKLTRESDDHEFVVGAGWSGDQPLWGTLDQGIVLGDGASTTSFGPLDGLPSGGVSALVVWQGRWIWGTTGQGVGWWSEHENPTVLR